MVCVLLLCGGRCSLLVRVWCETRRCAVASIICCVAVNSLIETLHQSGRGCYVDSNVSVECVMYADDLFLVSASIRQLQLIVEFCYREVAKLDMKFNASKSQANRIGKARRTDICHVTLNVCALCFVDELRLVCGVC